MRRLATQAFRGPVTDGDIADLMAFYDQGREDGDFESGMRMALQGILASPQFLFRVENTPATARAGAAYRVGDIELASRLSFFLWGTRARCGAREGRHGRHARRTTAVFEAQVARMLADPRAEALATRFGAAVAAAAGRRQGAARRHLVSRISISR